MRETDFEAGHGSGGRIFLEEDLAATHIIQGVTRDSLTWMRLLLSVPLAFSPPLPAPFPPSHRFPVAFHCCPRSFAYDQCLLAHEQDLARARRTACWPAS